VRRPFQDFLTILIGAPFGQLLPFPFWDLINQVLMVWQKFFSLLRRVPQNFGAPFY